MKTQHIGVAGELLVQYQLLKIGIDSSRMTIDAGIDLVVYAPGNRTASTVPVKTIMGAKPAGGRGALTRGWFFPDQCPAPTTTVQQRAVVLGRSGWTEIAEPRGKDGRLPPRDESRAAVPELSGVCPTRGDSGQIVAPNWHPGLEKAAA